MHADPAGSLSPILAVGCLALLILVLAGIRAAPGSAHGPDRLSAIDGLRGLLSLLVFLHHFAVTQQFARIGLWRLPQSRFYALIGPASVCLFFMVTGFLFFGKIKAVRGRLDINRFLVGRFFRIVPAYCASVAMIYAVAFYVTGPVLRQPVEYGLDAWVMFQSAPVNGFDQAPYINAVVQWTLSYEWAFYFALPPIAYVWSLLELRSWVVVLLAVAALLCVRTPFEIPFLGLDSQYFAPFALGGLVSEVGRVAQLRRLAATPYGTAVVLGSGLVFVLLFQNAYSLSGYLLLALLFAPIALGNSLFGLLDSRPLRFLGAISYDVYLFHGIVLFVLFRLAFPHTIRDAASPVVLFGLMLLACAVVVTLSTLVHVVVERPFLSVGRRLTPIDRTQELTAP